jgi:SAM-dependent methyltransferase
MNPTCLTNLSCNSTTHQLFLINGIPIIECDTCHHRYADIGNLDNHLEEVYSDEYFFEGKAGYPNYLESKDLLIKAGNRYARLISGYAEKGTMLDVGSAAGFIMKGFEMEGWKCYGVEPNDTMASYGRENFHFDIQTGSLENYTSEQKFDLVSMIQVIGHFYDLHQAIRNVKDLLKPNGLVLIESWNMKSLIAKLLGRRWHEYSPPSVLHWFSDTTIKQLFEKQGFRLIAKGHPVKKINVRHAVSLLDEKLPKFAFKKQILKQADILAGKYSVIYPLHDLKWYLFKLPEHS